MLGVLREREFRLLWLGQGAPTVGDRLLFVALALYVTEIGTPTDVGIVLAVLIFTGGVEIWMIVVIEVVFGAAEAFFRPAMTWLVPQTVSESQVQEANSAISVVNTVAEFAGPALATALVLGIGAGWDEFRARAWVAPARDSLVVC